MPTRNCFARPRVLCLFALVLLTMSASSCGHTQASDPDRSLDDVMEAVRNYGRDHAGAPSQSSSERPTEDSRSYQMRINSLLVERDFAQLERIAAQNRTEKGRVSGGIWKNNDFFAATSTANMEGSQYTDSDFESRIELVNRWIAGFPQSAAAHISLAQLYIRYAFFARGNGYANTVSHHQWRLFNERIAQAHREILVAATLKERDRHWYSVMLMLAQAKGWDKTDTRELLDQALAFEPEYYHYYRYYATYLLPQWYGDPGEIQDLADEVSERHPEPNSSILYFQIMSSDACYCRQQSEDLSHASYPKLLRGYTSLTEQYGYDNVIANRFAVMAAQFNDKASAREAFTHITAREPEIWLRQEDFDYVRAWADAPGTRPDRAHLRRVP
jgi:Domain of unknown function (DUF4034)